MDTEQFLQQFAEVVKGLREQLSISQEELGARAGLHRTYISDVECGARNLSLRTLCRLSRALNNYPSRLIALTEARLYPERADQVDEDIIRDLHHNAPAGFHSVDAQGLILHMNRTELSWLGYSPDEVIGRMNIREIVFAADLAVLEQHCLKLKETGASGPIKLRLACKGGEAIEVLLSATSLVDDAGRFLRSRASVFNISQSRLPIP